MSFADHVLILKVLIGKNLNFKIWTWNQTRVYQTGQIWKRVQDYTIDFKIYPQKKRVFLPPTPFFTLNVLVINGVYTLVIGGGGERDRLQK